MFTLRRLHAGLNSTAGELLAPDSKRLCATLERAWLNNKACESRIPPGTYQLAIKKLGTSRFDDYYVRLFGTFHQGMIHVDGVPDRSEILVHMANFYWQTEGCIIAGDRVVAQGKDSKNFQIPPGESRPGYLIAYPALLGAVTAGNASIAVTDPIANGEIPIA